MILSLKSGSKAGQDDTCLESQLIGRQRSEGLRFEDRLGKKLSRFSLQPINWTCWCMSVILVTQEG
jgi:hypothetical protein